MFGTARFDFKKKKKTKPTIKRRPRTTDLCVPRRRVLRLPDGPEAIHLGVVQVEGGIAGAGKGIVLEATDGEMTGAVNLRAAGLAVTATAGFGGAAFGRDGLPAVGALHETEHVRAAEQIFDVRTSDLLGPVEVDVAHEASRVVVEWVGRRRRRRRGSVEGQHDE